MWLVVSNSVVCNKSNELQDSALLEGNALEADGILKLSHEAADGCKDVYFSDGKIRRTPHEAIPNPHDFRTSAGRTSLLELQSTLTIVYGIAERIIFHPRPC